MKKHTHCWNDLEWSDTKVSDCEEKFNGDRSIFFLLPAADWKFYFYFILFCEKAFGFHVLLSKTWQLIYNNNNCEAQKRVPFIADMESAPRPPPRSTKPSRRSVFQEQIAWPCLPCTIANFAWENKRTKTKKQQTPDLSFWKTRNSQGLS